ncbi:hypothetical protein ACS0TY_036169 [Phlomoides rotata]
MMRRRRRISRPKKNKVSILEIISNDLFVSQILPRVASSSMTGIINLKLSCKEFNKIAEDKYIYKHVVLDTIPTNPWNPTKEEKELLNKCRESTNSESMYRLAVAEYFNQINPDLGSTHKNLDIAMKQGHVGAYYVKCIVLLLSDYEESKQNGIKMIKSKLMNKKRRLRSRGNLMNQLNVTWVRNPVLKERRALCCTAQHDQKVVQFKTPLPCGEEQVDQCEACIADKELAYICAKYNWAPIHTR